MREILIDLTDEIQKAKQEHETLVSSSAKDNEEEITKAENKLGNLETIKSDYGDFKVTLKKFTMRESTQMEEIMMGIAGGVKNMGKVVITNPNLMSMKVHAIKFGIKNIEPLIFDFKNDNAIMDLDNALFEFLYNKIDEFNSKNWTFRSQEKNS